jgi:cellulose synthase/poly-beta-1,6-N-acetylglucosamine synthase-like glycosyltransferase
MQDTIGDCLESLLNQTLPRSKYEIIVIDNNSTDNTRKVVRRYPVELLVEEQVGNFGGARNKGIRKSKGDIVAFIDADCTSRRDWIEKMLEVLDSNCNLAGIGGATTNPYTRNKVARTIAYAQNGDWYVTAPRRTVSYLPGCNCSYKRDALERVGLFPEGTASEDILLGREMRKSGYVLLFDPGIRIKHKFDTTLKKLAEKEERAGKGHFNMHSRGKNVNWVRLGALMLFSPIFALGRIGTGLRRIILYSDSKLDVFILLPHVFYSGFFWTRGYLNRAHERSIEQKRA